MTKSMIIANPSAGKGQAPYYANHLTDILKAQKKYVTTYITTSGLDITKYANRASEEKYDELYFMGGDGTINLGINGIAEKTYIPTVGILPFGTVNNFSRMIAMPQNYRKAILSMEKPSRTKADIGKVNELYFISSIRTGLLTDSYKEAEANRTRDFGILSNAIDITKILNIDATLDYHIILDGQLLEGKFSQIIIGQGHSLGGIKTFFPQNTYNDGLLSFAGLKSTNVMNKISLVPALLRGNLRNSEHVTIQSFKEAHILLKDDEYLLSAIDGEPGQSNPLKVSVLHKHIEMFVPNI